MTTEDDLTTMRDQPDGTVRCLICGRQDVEHDFGEFLAHLLEVPLEEGRRLQGRVVARLEGAINGEEA